MTPYVSDCLRQLFKRMLYKIIYAQFTPTLFKFFKLLYKRLYLKINKSKAKKFTFYVKAWTLEAGVVFKLVKQEFSCTNNREKYRILK